MSDELILGLVGAVVAIITSGAFVQGVSIRRGQKRAEIRTERVEAKTDKIVEMTVNDHGDDPSLEPNFRVEVTNGFEAIRTDVRHLSSLMIEVVHRVSALEDTKTRAEIKKLLDENNV